MGHKYVKEDETFNASRNGTVPKPTGQEVTDNKFLRADGTWQSGGGGGGGSTVSVDQVVTSGTEIGGVTVDGVRTAFFAPKPVAYSETEHIIGTWVDGKPLYEKTIVKSNINIGNNGSNIHTKFTHDVAAIKEAVDLCVTCPKMGIVAKDVLINLTSVLCVFRIDDTYIDAVSGSNYYGASADRVWYFTMRYTKTTD